MVGWQVDFWISYYQKCKKSKVKQYLWETGHMFTNISEECIAKKYFHSQFYHELIFFISCNCLIHENIVIKIRTDVRSLYYLSLKFWLFNFVKNLKVFSHVCFMSIRGKVMCIGLFLQCQILGFMCNNKSFKYQWSWRTNTIYKTFVQH